MLDSLKSESKQKPFTEEEAVFAAAAQDELAKAIAALLVVAECGTCNPKIPKKIMALAKLLEDEARTNHNVITTFLEQHEQK